MMYCFCWNVELGGIVICLFKVDSRSDKIILHHQHRIDHFARTCHPHFVPGHRFGRSHIGFMIAKNGIDRFCLVQVAYGRSRIAISRERFGPSTLGTEIWFPLDENP